MCMLNYLQKGLIKTRKNILLRLKPKGTPPDLMPSL